MVAVVAPLAQPIDDGDVLPVMYELLACMRTAFDRAPAGPPCSCTLLPGDDVPMDYCDCEGGMSCGQAWVRLDTSTEASSVYNSVYARTALQTGRCVTMLTHRLELGSRRCIPGMSADGSPPTDDQMMEAVRLQMGDYAAIRRALDCCFTLSRRREWLFDRYFPFGPMGNCVGGLVNISFRIV